MSLTIRRATKQDAREMAQLWATMAEDGADVGGWQIQTEAFLATDDYVGLVMVDSEDVVMGFIDGLVAYEPARSATQFIPRILALVEGKRGQGCAQLLLESALEAARRVGATEMVAHGEFGDKICGRVLGRPMEPYMSLSIGAI